MRARAGEAGPIHFWTMDELPSPSPWVTVPLTMNDDAKLNTRPDPWGELPVWGAGHQRAAARSSTRNRRWRQCTECGESLRAGPCACELPRSKYSRDGHRQVHRVVW